MGSSYSAKRGPRATLLDAQQLIEQLGASASTAISIINGIHGDPL